MGDGEAIAQGSVPGTEVGLSEKKPADFFFSSPPGLSLVCNFGSNTLTLSQAGTELRDLVSSLEGFIFRGDLTLHMRMVICFPTIFIFFYLGILLC